MTNAGAWCYGIGAAPEAEDEARGLIISRPWDPTPKLVRAVACGFHGAPTQLRGLIQRGVRVDVCAIFLHQRAAGAADLIDGMGSACAPEVGEYMANPKVRYLTF